MKIRKIKHKIKGFLKNHKNFLISAHIGPEGDCLGAQLAFARVIKGIGKNCDIVNSEPYAKEYAFLPKIDDIKTKPKTKKYDAAIILDCSDISRIGKVTNFLDNNIPILNIDHHISNTYFGDINLVDVTSSSTCEILYFLFKELNIEIDKLMAIYLYVGILTDTGSFRYTNTSALTHFVAFQLLNSFDIDAAKIFRNVYENLDYSDIKLINKILLDLKRDTTGKLAWVKVTQNLLKKYKPKIDLTDSILNFIRSIKGVEVGVILREQSGKGNNIRANLRSRGKIDVNQIAGHFGGGGHKTASGVTLRNVSLGEAENKIINFIKKKIAK